MSQASELHNLTTAMELSVGSWHLAVLRTARCVTVSVTTKSYGLEGVESEGDAIRQFPDA